MALVRGKVRQRSLKEIQNDIISWGVIILSLKTDEIKQYQRRKNTEKTVCWLLLCFLSATGKVCSMRRVSVCLCLEPVLYGNQWMLSTRQGQEALRRSSV